MSDKLGTCPQCGKWAWAAIRRPGGRSEYTCASGHHWSQYSSGLRVIDGGHNHHEFSLEQTTVYVAGPMAGMPDHNFPAFEAATRILSEHGVTVVSPHEDVSVAHLKLAEELGEDYRNSPEYRNYLARDIGLVAKCDALVLLPGYEHSKGAMAEVYFARAVGIPCYSIKDMLNLLRDGLEASGR